MSMTKKTVVVTKRGKPALTPADAMRGLFSIDARLRGTKLRTLIEEGPRF